MRNLFFLGAIIAFCFIGCSANYVNIEKSMINTSIELDKDQYTISQEVSGEASVKTWLLLFSTSNSKRNLGKIGSSVPIGPSWGYSRLEQMAVFDALSKKKGIDALIAPKFQYKKYSFFPFYSSKSVIVTGKGIKIKASDQQP